MESFEDHCWRDVVSSELLEIYAHYKRPITIGPNIALLGIDLWEMAYQGGALPVREVAKQYPSSCGINAWNAMPPTQALLAAARRAGLPIFFSTADTNANSKPGSVSPTLRQGLSHDPKLYEIRPEFGPQPGDIVIRKQRASAFFGTPLIAHLQQLGIKTIIIFGESTSGCVRSSTVDGYSHGFQMVMAEECCFDRSDISHKISLFDLHHKYANVIHTDEIIAHLDKLAAQS